VKKITKETWLTEGLLALAEVGPHALTVDFMCQRLAVTKGSFYHHFKNRQDYVEEILKLWEEENTSRLIGLAEANQGIQTKIDALLKLVYEIPPDREIAVRALALYDPLARRYQERIDQKRQAYLLDLNRHFFKDAKEAELLAAIDYAWFLGLISIFPRIKKPHLSQIIATYKQMKFSFMHTREENKV
jgi:AcrR family transcriptional regulator